MHGQNYIKYTIANFAWRHLVLRTGALTSRNVLLPSTSRQNFFPT